ncbi:molybdate ABC transporter substrate-binding protein [Streptomyces sp. TR06-5]|uniref:molybdate ABC transporter substrate-binding protein n=1 Tax=Streptomyces sp. TR06-5 TaxID=3385976 RepID=UPI0039A34B42
MPSRRTAAALLALLFGPAAVGCGSVLADDGGGRSGGTTTVTVLAASSLTDAFGSAEHAYEAEHPRVDLRISYAGSQTLAAQVRQGAPADVLATADTRTMRSVSAETGRPRIVATNRLTVVTAPGNPHGIRDLRDLADPSLKVVLAAEEVPVGGYSREVLAEQDVHVRPVSLESDVRAVLGKVELGEADAGIVYETDAHSGGDKVAQVPVPVDRNAVASYPVAVLKESAHPEGAAAFIRWLGSEEGFTHLREQGFRRP